MGGNALTPGLTRRFLKEEYEAVRVEIESILSIAFPGCRYSTIRSYAQKESFGDIDILLESNDLGNIREIIQGRFKPSEIVHNGTVWSFDYKTLQVDLILSSAELFDVSDDYFAFNDCGNLISRIAFNMGLSNGHKGLLFKVNDGTQQIGVITLSTNTKEIHEFLGYDHDRYLKGFDTLEDIFEFVVSSPYYNYSIFSFENRNSVARIRDIKRKTYTEFLVWAEERKASHSQYAYQNKKAYLSLIFDTFPESKVKYEEFIQLNEDRKLIKRFMNGDRISVLTGLTHKSLGLFMRHLREDWPELEILAKNERVDEEVWDNIVKRAYDNY